MICQILEKLFTSSESLPTKLRLSGSQWKSCNLDFNIKLHILFCIKYSKAAFSVIFTSYEVIKMQVFTTKFAFKRVLRARCLPIYLIFFIKPEKTSWSSLWLYKIRPTLNTLGLGEPNYSNQIKIRTNIVFEFICFSPVYEVISPIRLLHNNIYRYWDRGKIKTLYFHPHKPVSLLLTHQGIFKFPLMSV